MSSRFSADAARALPAEVLRAVIRERAHHILETSLQEALLGKPPAESHGLETVERLLQVWEKRGLAASGDDLAWVRKLVQWTRSGPEEISFTQRFSDEEISTVRRLIQERRSVRFWEGRPVPQEMLEEIVRAGQWAPCACNLQTLRVLIVNNPEPDVAELFEGEVSGAPAHLLICQDRRPYEFYRTSVPEHNRGLDCGAAMQNMLLMAHALGLGAVWLTFFEPQRQALRKHLNIPDYIDVVSYISLGWPAIEPLPPGRMELEAVLLRATGA